jgi:hypothetical protein
MTPSAAAKATVRHDLLRTRIARFVLSERKRGRRMAASARPILQVRGRRREHAPPRLWLLHRIIRRLPDPISLAVLAIDHVGPAAVRACASGVEVRVVAPDEATAAVLRAALAETARRRDTDRLVRIVVD